MTRPGSLDEEELLRRLSGELGRLHSWDDVAAYAIEPLVAGGRMLGCLVIGFEAPRVFDAEEQALFAAAATRCAQALETRRRR